MSCRPTKYAASTIAALFVISVAASCGQDNNLGQSDSPPTVEDSAQPNYPPPQFTWDIPIPLDEPMLSAAQFAVESAALFPRALSEADPTARHEFNSRVIDQQAIQDYEVSPLTGTGAMTFRVVGVEQKSSHIVVSICEYDIPGVYDITEDGELVLSEPDAPYSLQQPSIRNAAEYVNGNAEISHGWIFDRRGETASKPVKPNDPEMLAKVENTCRPFAPEPFARKPPQQLPGK
ncbi:hypothetical protein [Nocardia abscessus]|uniref:hypothetical protein n=1 Tax=Nocardia abscessus TaxID=120957 RepID=UPI0012F9605D|nr:hypothetical protein [Nocardia abscessus]MCC3333405.1 hypothetical protein [Nocardia abscessus]